MKKSELKYLANRLQDKITCNLKIIEILEDILVDESALGSTQRAAKWLETVKEEFQDQDTQLTHTLDCYWDRFGWEAKWEFEQDLKNRNSKTPLTLG